MTSRPLCDVWVKVFSISAKSEKAKSHNSKRSQYNSYVIQFSLLIHCILNLNLILNRKWKTSLVWFSVSRYLWNIPQYERDAFCKITLPCTCTCEHWFMVYCIHPLFLKDWLSTVTYPFLSRTLVLGFCRWYFWPPASPRPWNRLKSYFVR